MISEARLEAAAQAVMKLMGWNDQSGERLIDQRDNPRVREWVEIAQAALSARAPRNRAGGAS